MSWGIEAAVAAKVGFATHQNAIPVIRELSIVAGPDGSASDLTLSLLADPPFVQTKSWRIDAMMPGDVLRISDRDVALNATLLHELSRRIGSPGSASSTTAWRNCPRATSAPSCAA